jgi:hypothetical protein
LDAAPFDVSHDQRCALVIGAGGGLTDAGTQIARRETASEEEHPADTASDERGETGDVEVE